MSEKITIVIPTHNRHALIERALGYYKTFGCPVIVCDSSQSKSNFLLHPKIKVLYTLAGSVETETINPPAW